MWLEYEYDEEQDDPIRVVLDVPLPQRHRVTLGAVPAPDPRYTVVTREYEFNVDALKYYGYPDNPELDWVEVLLS